MRNFPAGQEEVKLQVCLGKDTEQLRTERVGVETVDRAVMKVRQPPAPEILLQLCDQTRSRNEVSGKVTIDTLTLIENKKIKKIWAPLENSDSGEILLSASFSPSASYMSREESPLEDPKDGKIDISENKKIPESAGLFSGGKSTLTLVQAKELKKKDIFSKSDPYAVISFNETKLKTKTIKNSHQPEWSHEFEIEETGPEGTDVTIQLFNKKSLAKDDPLGRVTFSTKELLHHLKIMNRWYPLEDTKSGQVLVSGEFAPNNPEISGVVESVQSPPEGQELPRGKFILEFIKGRNIALPGESKKKPNSLLKILTSEGNFLSKVVKNSNSPEWKYSMELSTDNLVQNYIDLEVMSQDKTGEETEVGKSRIFLSDLIENENPTQWSNLESSPGSVMFYAKFHPVEVIGTIIDDSDNNLPEEIRSMEPETEKEISLEDKLKEMLPDDCSQVVAIEVKEEDYNGIQTSVKKPSQIIEEFKVLEGSSLEVREKSVTEVQEKSVLEVREDSVPEFQEESVPEVRDDSVPEVQEKSVLEVREDSVPEVLESEVLKESVLETLGESVLDVQDKPE